MIFSQTELNIPQKNYNDSIIENVRDPTLKAILKYRKHPSILAKKRKIKSGSVRRRMLLKRQKKLRRLKSITRR